MDPAGQEARENLSVFLSVCSNGAMELTLVVSSTRNIHDYHICLDFQGCRTSYTRQISQWARCFPSWNRAAEGEHGGLAHASKARRSRPRSRRGYCFPSYSPGSECAEGTPKMGRG